MPKKGYKQTAEHRANVGKASKGRVPWNKGKKTGPLSDEHKSKIGASSSKALTGRKLSKEHSLKISERLTGRIVPDDIRDKISAGMIGNANNPMLGISGLGTHVSRHVNRGITNSNCDWCVFPYDEVYSWFWGNKEHEEEFYAVVTVVIEDPQYKVWLWAMGGAILLYILYIVIVLQDWN